MLMYLGKSVSVVFREQDYNNYEVFTTGDTVRTSFINGLYVHYHFNEQRPVTFRIMAVRMMTVSAFQSVQTDAKRYNASWQTMVSNQMFSAMPESTYRVYEDQPDPYVYNQLNFKSTIVNGFAQAAALTPILVHQPIFVRDPTPIYYAYQFSVVYGESENKDNIQKQFYNSMFSQPPVINWIHNQTAPLVMSHEVFRS